MASTAGTTILRGGSSAAAASSSAMKWALGCWVLFIAENAVLSENRTWLIEQLGKEQYHACYGVCSTAATASIGYAYWYKLKTPQATAAMARSISMPALALSWTCLSAGLVLASQALPKLQVPVALTRTGAADSSNTAASTAATTEKPSSNAGAASSSWELQVRCPFDFTGSDHSTDETAAVRGLDRITRHPGLWSFALIGMANASLAPTAALQAWWLGPAAVAWLGGMHTDSRFRRGLGGTMDPVLESQTSNVPAAAILTGRQGHPATVLVQLVQEELKTTNALLGVAAATVYVASRGRVVIMKR